MMAPLLATFTPAPAGDPDQQLGGAPGPRPLYLMACGQCSIRLDGPALVISMERRVKARYPLERISRVVSAQQVEWSAQALSACVARGIPIILLDAGGTPVGYVQPVASSLSTLDALLHEFVERSDWQRHYDNWLRSERMRAVRAWLCERQNDGHPVAEREARELVRQYVYVCQLSPALEGHPGVYRAALMALVCEKLHQAGLASMYVTDNGMELHLATNLCDLFATSFELRLQGFGSKLAPQTKECLRIIEAYSEAFEAGCAQVLGRLYRRVKCLQREWH